MSTKLTTDILAKCEAAGAELTQEGQACMACQPGGGKSESSSIDSASWEMPDCVGCTRGEGAVQRTWWERTRRTIW